MTNVEIVLAGLLVFQQVYWTIQVHRLVNKLMSRDFAEYKQVMEFNKNKEIKVKIPMDEPEDLRVLQEFQM